MNMRKKPLIIADNQIPYLEGIPERYARIVRMPYHRIDAAALRCADALLVRTRTLCSKELLQGSSVTFVGSPTIGTDHIDLDYCATANIAVAHAPGCNAGAVMQYVFTALAVAATQKNMCLSDKTIGIVGVGNVGSRVERLAGHLGMKTLLNDPPRAVQEGADSFCSLDFLLSKADVVTLHVPLDATTRGMADRSFFDKMKEGAFFINTSRGDVTNEQALQAAASGLGAVVLDVWQNEPHIDKKTLDATHIATPHIAGYSMEGKRNATETVVRALAAHFQWEELLQYAVTLPSVEEVPSHALFTQCFPIMEEDKRLRSAPDLFEEQRNAYVYRREWTREQYNALTFC